MGRQQQASSRWTVLPNTIGRFDHHKEKPSFPESLFLVGTFDGLINNKHQQMIKNRKRKIEIYNFFQPFWRRWGRGGDGGWD
jgi:hypothetical protein